MCYNEKDAIAEEREERTLKTVFIVDDNDVNLLSAEEALNEQYRVYTLKSARVMLELLEVIKPDLILLDIEMPEINGFEAMRLLKSNSRYAGISVIFLTGRCDETAEVLGFEMGAVDFITKPFSRLVLLNRIKTHLDIDDIIHEQTAEIRKQKDELQRLKDSIVSGLARVVENRDNMTGEHIERTTTYIKILLKALLQSGVYADEISRWDIESVALSARLHDVGKVAVSDLILNKPGKLTGEEFETMKKHVLEGEKIIGDIIDESGDQIFLHNAKLFAGCHHERWNGTGYPRGLKGEEIPLQGRIMAIVDVYDALVSDRPYKSAFSHEQAMSIISENRGSHFDPAIVDVFMEVHDRFAEVRSSQ